jgi:hypothetical protein
VTRDKAGQGIVPGFLDAAARTRLETDGKLPGGLGLFDVDRLRNMERPAVQTELPDGDGCDCHRCTGYPPQPCGRCGNDGGAGAAGLCADCDAEAAAACDCGGVTYHYDGCPADGQKGGKR